MSTLKPGADRNRRVLSVLGVAGMLFAMGVGVYVFRGCSSSDVESTASPTAKSAAAKDSVPAIEIPKFGRPEEAARYFDAVIEGDRRSIELIDRALAEGKAQPDAGSGYVKELERERGVRAARLEAYEKARRSVTGTSRSVATE